MGDSAGLTADDLSDDEREDIEAQVQAQIADIRAQQAEAPTQPVAVVGGTQQMPILTPDQIAAMAQADAARVVAAASAPAKPDPTVKSGHNKWLTRAGIALLVLFPWPPASIAGVMLFAGGGILTAQGVNAVRRHFFHRKSTLPPPPTQQRETPEAEEHEKEKDGHEQSGPGVNTPAQPEVPTAEQPTVEQPTAPEAPEPAAPPPTAESPAASADGSPEKHVWTHEERSALAKRVWAERMGRETVTYRTAMDTITQMYVETQLRHVENGDHLSKTAQHDETLTELHLAQQLAHDALETANGKAPRSRENSAYRHALDDVVHLVDAAVTSDNPEVALKSIVGFVSVELWQVPVACTKVAEAHEVAHRRARVLTDDAGKRAAEAEAEREAAKPKVRDRRAATRLAAQEAAEAELPGTAASAAEVRGTPTAPRPQRAPSGGVHEIT